MSTPVVIETDTFSQACLIHCYLCDCTGAYAGPVQTPGQTVLKVNGDKVVRSQQVHTYGCPDCSSNRVIVNASTVLKVNGVPVALAGAVVGAHNNGPIGGSAILKA